MSSAVFLFSVLFAPMMAQSQKPIENSVRPSDQPFRVLIDPGHGGTDGGALAEGVKESVLNLAVSKMLKQRLEKEPGILALLTRHNDKDLSLKARRALSEQMNADLFVSIHMNASLNSEARGLEVFFQNQLPPDEDALFLAHYEENSANGSEPHPSASYLEEDKELSPEVKTILFDMQNTQNILQSARVAAHIYSSWSGYKAKPLNSMRPAPFYVLKTPNPPSILVELGYLTNPKESRLLQSQAYQARLVEDLARGILKFKETSDKPNKSSLWFGHETPAKTFR